MNINTTLLGLHTSQLTTQSADRHERSVKPLELSGSSGSSQIKTESAIEWNETLYNIPAPEQPQKGIDDKTFMQLHFNLNDEEYERYTTLKQQDTQFYRLEETRPLSAAEKYQWNAVHHAMSQLFDTAAGQKSTRNLLGTA
ncbi:MAG: hypothetical protein OIF55_05315 [Amphritea sp.]|nr:hypothetical protein [Amphritea sp.]